MKPMRDKIDRDLKKAALLLTLLFLLPVVSCAYPAGHGGDASVFYLDSGWYWQDSDEMVMILYPSQTGEYCASYVMKTGAETVYEVNTGIAAGADILTQEELDSISEHVFKGSTAAHFSTKQAAGRINAAEKELRINAVKKKLAEEYGGAYVRDEAYVAPEQYLPLAVTVREEQAHSGILLASRLLRKGMTTASATASLAAWLGTECGNAYNTLCVILGEQPEMGAVLADSHEIELMRGTTVTVRTGTVTGPGGRAVPCLSAMRTYERNYIIYYDPENTSSSFLDYIVDAGCFSEVYIPSAASFDYAGLASAAYAAYNG